MTDGEEAKPALDQYLVPERKLVSLTDSEVAEAHRGFLAAATSDNTRRTYQSAIRCFQDWGGLLPCNEAVIIHYLVEHAAHLNPRTLSLRLTALSRWHRYQGFIDPTDTENVRKTLKGIFNTYGTPPKKSKALPMEDMEQLVMMLLAQEGLVALRDNALLQLGFFGAFRRCELSKINAEDVERSPDGLIITLPRSKTDQVGEGMKRGIPYGRGICCPATALKRWMDAAGITTGPLFRRITRWNTVGAKALNPASINAILDKRANEAGLAYAPDLSSHSLRRGMATSADRAGADFRDIKRQGGWTDDKTVEGYIEDRALFEHNAAGILLGRSG